MTVAPPTLVTLEDVRRAAAVLRGVAVRTPLLASEELQARSGVPVWLTPEMLQRGGAFKVRTSPTAFQGLGWDGWKLLREAADAHGLLTVSEILDEGQIEPARRYVDFAQIGSRNMQNIPLLKALGR